MKNKFYSTILFFVFVVMSAQVVPQPNYGPESYPYWGTVIGTSVPMNDVKPQEWRVDGQTIQGWDWSLPSFITKPENSSFSLLKLNLGETKDENAFIALKKPTFPCSPSISIWLKWSQVEVTRGKFDFTQLTKAIDLAKAKGMHVIVRLHSAAPNFAPQWFNNLNIPTVSGGKVSYYDPKNATFHEHYLKLVAALGQSGIPNREDVTGLYVGWASGSYGDEGIGPFTGNNSSSLNSEDPIVKQRLDAWENILAPANRKKVFMGGECTYGQSKGFGVRRGFVEMYTNNIPADYIGQKLDGNGYLYVDESVPVIKDNLFNGDENEEYSTNWTIDGRFGKDRDSYNYRYFSSSIRVLQMRTNELLNYENALLPEMTAWVGTNLGRTVGNAPDIFCFLRETNILNINVKNFERWLYQRDAPGYTTVATKKIFYDGYRSTNVRNTGTEPFHDKIAREGNKIGFNIDQNWPGIKGTMAFKISVFDDNAAGTLNLKYFNGTEIVTLSKPLLGDKLLKTYTFFVSNFKIGGNIGGKFDFTLESGDATSNILVSFVRVVQAQPSGNTVSYSVSASAGANGTITPNGSVAVNSGASQTFAIAANSGYMVDVVMVDGVSQGAISSYTFSNVTANHSISATFKAKQQYSITASAGANGTITPNGSVAVNSGASQIFAIAANSGYMVDVVTVDGVSQGAISSYTFNTVTANHSISATFKAKQYSITASAGANGTITPNGSLVVNSGANQIFAIASNSGYEVGVVTVDGVSQGAISSYTFSNVTTNHSISATFKAKQQYTITASAGANGTITPNGSLVVNSGASQTYAIAANSGYEVDAVTVNGTLLSTPVTTYTFSNVTANQTINVLFKAKIQQTKVVLLKPWQSGMDNAKVAGSNRMMVVMVMGESGANFTANSAIYGGQPMTRVSDHFVTSGSTTYCAIFVLKEAGVNAAASGVINIGWSATPSSGFSVYSALLSNVDQTAAVVKSSIGLAAATSISTSALAASSGDMVIMCGANGSNNTITFNNGFTKQFESNSTWGDGIGGSKMGSGVNETASFTQSATGRMVLCSFVVKKASASTQRLMFDGKSETVSKNRLSIYPNPTSDILNVDFLESKNIKEVKVFNMAGQLLYSLKTSNSSVQIDVQSLNVKGGFILQVFDGESVSSHKIIVK